MLYQIIIASVVGGIFSLIGGIILLTKEAFARRISLLLVSFASGSLLGAAFLDLFPEAIELFNGMAVDVQNVFIFAIVGILSIFIFEKFLKWHHCHDSEICDYHGFSSTILIGDAIHNFIDGIVIAFSFAVNPSVGIAATIAIFFHEVPQEISDFGVLLHAGYSRKKILIYNFFAASSTLLGAIMGYFALPFISHILPYLISFAAGTFIYIATADLIPELKHKTKGLNIIHFIAMIVGVFIIWFVGKYFGK